MSLEYNINQISLARSEALQRFIEFVLTYCDPKSRVRMVSNVADGISASPILNIGQLDFGGGVKV